MTFINKFSNVQFLSTQNVFNINQFPFSSSQFISSFFQFVDNINILLSYTLHADILFTYYVQI